MRAESSFGFSELRLGWDMSRRQNYGPLLGPLNTRCCITLRTQKGTITLTTTHMFLRLNYCSILLPKKRNLWRDLGTTIVRTRMIAILGIPDAPEKVLSITTEPKGSKMLSNPSRSPWKRISVGIQHFSQPVWNLERGQAQASGIFGGLLLGSHDDRN